MLHSFNNFIKFACMFHLDTSIQIMLGHAIHQVKDLSISLLSIKGSFLFWNSGAKLLDGYEQDEIIGKPLTTLHPITEKKENLGEYLLTTANKNGRVKHIGRRVKKDGTVYLASVIINSIFDEAGCLIGYVRIARELRANELE
jgi:PAS domain S-box-containing protein